MAMTAWTAFLPQVLNEVPGCPRPMAVEAIRNAAIEFCEKTFLWKCVQQDAYPVGGGIGDYEFEAEPKTRVHRIDHASLAQGGDLDILSPKEVDDRFPGWQRGSQGGSASQCITQVSPEAFWIVPFPSSNDDLTLTVSLKPTRDSVSGPPFLFDDHYELIAAGAKARLMVTAGKAWSNAQQAGVYLAAFNEAIEKQRLRTSKAWGRGKNRVVARFL